MSVKHLVRKNIVRLKPYSSARDDFKGQADVWLDANESPYTNSFNRYPDPHHTRLRKELAKVKNVKPNQLLLGNGSDEIIDLIFKTFCDPLEDKALCFTPTYGMYQVVADIHNCQLLQFPLNATFEIPIKDVIALIEIEKPKIALVCSPNNPTANLIPKNQILDLLSMKNLIVVVDEAYIDFANDTSRSEWIEKYPNLIIIQTLSKAWGLAAIRLGMAIAQTDTLFWIKKVKPPYNINGLTLFQAVDSLQCLEDFTKNIFKSKVQRKWLISQLRQLTIVTKIYPSDSNFILVTFKNADEIYSNLTAKGVIIRNRTKLVPNALRITVGTEVENKKLISELNFMCP